MEYHTIYLLIRLLLLVTNCYQLIGSLKHDEIADLSREPAVKYVCEGDTALLEWTHINPIGNYQYKQIVKVKPYKELIKQYQDRKPVNDNKRATLLPENHLSQGFILDETELSDSGMYNLIINFDDSRKPVHDTAELVVIESSACPNRYQYFNPSVYVSSILGKQTNKQMFNNSYLDLSRPGDIAFLVKAPSANPPVLVTVTKGGYQVNCSGSSNMEKECYFTGLFGQCDPGKVLIQQTFIALQPIFMAFEVRLTVFQEPAENSGTSTMSTAVPPYNRAGDREIPVEYYSGFIILLCLACFSVAILIVLLVMFIRNQKMKKVKKHDLLLSRPTPSLRDVV